MENDLQWSESQVHWRSRRGLLELDLILIPYAATQYTTLPEAQKQQHHWLLLQMDMNLQQWLIYRNLPEDLSYTKIDYIKSIWQFIQNR